MLDCDDDGRGGDQGAPAAHLGAGRLLGAVARSWPRRGGAARRLRGLGRAGGARRGGRRRQLRARVRARGRERGRVRPHAADGRARPRPHGGRGLRRRVGGGRRRGAARSRTRASTARARCSAPSSRRGPRWWRASCSGWCARATPSGSRPGRPTAPSWPAVRAGRGASRRSTRTWPPSGGVGRRGHRARAARRARRRTWSSSGARSPGPPTRPRRSRASCRQRARLRGRAREALPPERFEELSARHARADAQLQHGRRRLAADRRRVRGDRRAQARVARWPPRLLLEYDGSEFAGWARQPGRRTVQGVLEEALATVLRREVAADRRRAHRPRRARARPGGQPRGRPRPAPLAERRPAPMTCAVLASEPAADGFDARRDARSRTYRYRLLTRSAPSPFERDRALWWPRRVDRDALDACAAALPGTHDFTAFTPTDSDARALRARRAARRVDRGERATCSPS